MLFRSVNLEGVTNVTYYYTTDGNEPTDEDEETDGEIIISDVEGSGNVFVYDIMGRPVLTRHANGNVNIPTSSLTGGIYIISLIDDNGIKTQKIAINK